MRALAAVPDRPSPGMPARAADGAGPGARSRGAAGRARRRELRSARRRSAHGWRGPLGCVALLALGPLSGCAVPVASGLGDAEANAVVVALEQQGIPASREPDPGAESAFRVTVARSDATGAAGVLAGSGLPAERKPGVLEALGDGALVPSRAAEHARLVAGTAGELERSLQGVEGVVAARVHLAVPEADRLSLQPPTEKARASVLLRHRGATPPLAPEAVQRLVAGAVPGLAHEQVEVVLAASPATAVPPTRELARLGPLSVSRASLGPLKGVLAGAVFVALALVAALVLVWRRLRLAEARLEQLAGAAAPGAPQ